MQTLALGLLVSTLLPIVLALSTIPFRFKQFGQPDIQNPRYQGSLLEGVGERLVHAQANAWEALAMLCASLLTATIMAVEANALQSAVYFFIAARICHGVFYIVNIGPLRFISFLTGFMSCLWIFRVSFM